MLLRFKYGVGDPDIGAAAAQIAAHALADPLGIVPGLAFLDQADGAHDLARRAESALKAVMCDEGRLDGMEFCALRHALDREDVGTVMTNRQRQARSDPPPIHQHSAGAALSAVASFLRSDQVETLTQKIEQRDARVGELEITPLAIDDEADGKVHAMIRSMLWSNDWHPERRARQEVAPRRHD